MFFNWLKSCFNKFDGPMDVHVTNFVLEIRKENSLTGEDIYLAEFKEFDVSSQGNTIEEAKQNALEALSLFVETASRSEMKRRLRPTAEGPKRKYTKRRLKRIIEKFKLLPTLPIQSA